MADICSAQTGVEGKEVAERLDAESRIGGSAVGEQGFADELLPSDRVATGGGQAGASAVRRIEAGLAAGGMPESDAVRLISEFKSSVGDSAGGGEGDPTEGRQGVGYVGGAVPCR